MFEITGYYFFGPYVIYSSMIRYDRFLSIHNRAGLTDEQAMNQFKEKHYQEVKILIQQKLKNENDKSEADNLGLIIQQA